MFLINPKNVEKMPEEEIIAKWDVDHQVGNMLNNLKFWMVITVSLLGAYFIIFELPIITQKAYDDIVKIRMNP